MFLYQKAKIFRKMCRSWGEIIPLVVLKNFAFRVYDMKVCIFMEGLLQRSVGVLLITSVHIFSVLEMVREPCTHVLILREITCFLVGGRFCVSFFFLPSLSQHGFAL